MLQNPVFRCFIGFVIGCLLSLALIRLVRWRHARAVARRWRGKPIVTALLLLLMPLALLAVGGCASNVTQQQQFQQSVTFWSSEVTTLRKAVEALPPGSQRDKALKDLQTAEFWVAFFTPLLNPPATQPVATVK